ncbi:MAG: DUF72 domain-containing protein [Armatimonadota bacterium]
MGDIRIGTSGFSYDDWKGFFYPEKTRKGDMLAYYAQHFKVVEINSSYYAMPSPITFERMSAKTPDDFEFVIKAHQDITHAPQVSPDSFKSFNNALEPLIAQKKLGCVLAQYPWNFKHTPANIDRINQLRDGFEDVPVIVEFRNSEWVSESTFKLLRDNNLGFCCVDEPKLKGLMPPLAVATSSIGYLRFHGRNAAKWWQHEEAWQRYDYRYSENELQEWIPMIASLAQVTDKSYVFFNNHYQSKAADNAKQFCDMLSTNE